VIDSSITRFSKFYYQHQSLEYSIEDLVLRLTTYDNITSKRLNLILPIQSNSLGDSIHIKK